MKTLGYGYRCAAGESFDAAAQFIWGDERRAPELMSVNPEHTDKLIFEGGELLYIPEIEDAGNTAQGEAITAPWRR